MSDTNRDKLIEQVKQRHVSYKETFASETGKLVLKDLTDACYMTRSTITDGSTVDPYQIAFREGQRSIVLRITNLMSDAQLKNLGDEDTKSK